MKILESNSQVHQDVFVISVLKQRGGFFLEIGGFHSREISNTFLLENGFGWMGVTVEIDPERASELRANRQSTVLQADATRIKWRSMVRSLLVPRAPDYLQVDCEPALSSLVALSQVLVAGIRPRVITFEHDAYAKNSLMRIVPQGRFVRWCSRAMLAILRYRLVAPNIGTRDSKKAFEDWWVRREIPFPKSLGTRELTVHSDFLSETGLYRDYQEFARANLSP